MHKCSLLRNRRRLIYTPYINLFVAMCQNNFVKIHVAMQAHLKLQHRIHKSAMIGGLYDKRMF